jgi:hypothetical protein
VPCLHRGSYAGVPLIPPPFPIVIVIFRAPGAPLHSTSLPFFPLPSQPACCSVSSFLLLPGLQLCSSQIAISQDNLNINSAFPDYICPCFHSAGVSGVVSQLVGFLAPSTMLIVRGFIARCHHPSFMVRGFVAQCRRPFRFRLGCLCLPSHCFAHCDPPFLCSYWGSGRHIW